MYQAKTEGTKPNNTKGCIEEIGDYSRLRLGRTAI
jgi:hypothetical protein